MPTHFPLSLVTIGLGENAIVLDSAEFFDLNTKKWTKTSSLKVGRTEHVMSLVYGIPTVIGGKYYTITVLCALMEYSKHLCVKRYRSTLNHRMLYKTTYVKL